MSASALSYCPTPQWDRSKVFNKNGQKDRTLDASDLVSVFAAAVLKSANASGKGIRYSNWVGNNLNGAISEIEEISDQYLIETRACGNAPHKEYFGRVGLRVLKYRGRLIGSASFPEAYHARSTFCYTPCGFKLLCDRGSLSLEKLHPRVDGLPLILRHIFMSLGMEIEEWDNWNKLMQNGGALLK